MAWSTCEKNILSKGIHLAEIGINNWALTKKQAITALESLEDKGIGVSGGDVLRLENGEFNHTYDNWSYECQKDQKIDEYIAESIGYARNYINTYQGKGEYFVLTLSFMKKQMP